MLPNPNAGSDTETAAVGVRLHGFSIFTINVTALDERSEQSLANRLLCLRNKVCTEGLCCEELHALANIPLIFSAFKDVAVDGKMVRPEFD
jgi:hypothetical protein